MPCLWGCTVRYFRTNTYFKPEDYLPNAMGQPLGKKTGKFSPDSRQAGPIP